MKSLLILSLFLSFTTVSFAQQWGVNTVSTYTNEGLDVAVDNLGNTIVCGYISGETAFTNTFNFPFALGNGDAFVAKYDATGNLTWTKKFGGNFSDRAQAVALTSNDEILVTGQYFGSVTFGATTLTSNSNSKDIFVVKLDATGNVIWAISEGGANDENVYDIETDVNDNFILIGQFNGTSVLGGQTFTSSLNPVVNQSSFDFFISKFNSSGGNIWTKVGQSIYENRAVATKLDAAGNVYVIGQFSDTLTFAGTQINNPGLNVGFFTKLDTQGNMVFFNRIIAGMCSPKDIALNNFNEAIITGDYLGGFAYLTSTGSTTMSNAFDNKIFVLKTDALGNNIWNNSLGSDNNINVSDIDVNSNKDIFISGNFECSLDELHTPTAHFNSVGFKDIFVWKLSDGNLTQYTKQMGGIRDDEVSGLALLNNEPIITGGYTNHLYFPNQINGTGGPLTNNNYPNFNLSSSSQYFYYLQGDASRNMFLTNWCNHELNVYNYFKNVGNTTNPYNSQLDSLEGFIAPTTNYSLNADTVNICPDDGLFYQTRTYDFGGPAYYYNWNTGDTTQAITPIINGDFSVEVERIDGCTVKQDTIHAIHHPITAVLQTDNLGIAVLQDPEYADYELCEDSVEIEFTHLIAGQNLNIFDAFTNQTLFTDTLPHFYHNGSYVVELSNTYCSTSEDFVVEVDDSIFITIDMVPYLTLVDEIDYNDSITICENDFFRAQLLDSTNNPTGLFNFPSDDPEISVSFLITDPNNTATAYNQSSTPDYSVNVVPTITGWYTVSAIGLYGEQNFCNAVVDTVYAVDSFYIEVLPFVPATTVLTANNLLCLGGTVFVTATPALPNFSWNGPGVASITTNGDTLIANAPGTYDYQGTTINQNGCSEDQLFSIDVIQKSPPNITFNPSDGIICPYDSVLMSVPNIYVSYEWFGPSSTNLSTTHTHEDDDQGSYYCVVEDVDGCFLTTPMINIEEYSTPYLLVQPSQFLCDDSTQIEAITFGDGVFQWFSPISDTSSVITVNQPGWYSAQFTQCGITTIDSIEIFDGSFTPTLVYTDTMLCDNESILVSITNANGNATWNSGDFGLTIQANSAGDYYASIINQYGCEANTDTATIYYTPYPAPIPLTDTFLCINGDITLNAPFTVDWFSDTSQILTSNSSFTFTNLNSDTSIIYSQIVPECLPVYETVNVFVHDPITNLSFTGDTIACFSDTISLTANSSEGNYTWQESNGSFIANDSIINLAQSNIDSLILISSNNCFADSLFVNIGWNVATVLTGIPDTVFGCYGIAFEVSADNADTLVWSNGSNAITTDTLSGIANPMIGTWYINGLDSLGCPFEENTLEIIQINESFYIESIQNIICDSDSALFTVSTELDSIWWSGNSLDTNNIMLDTISLTFDHGVDTWIYANSIDPYGCSYIDSINVSLADSIVNQWPADTTLCTTDLFFNNGQNNYALTFTDSISYVENTVDTLYFELENYLGCTVTDSIVVSFINCDDPTPNVITPNGDGMNDVLIIDEVAIYPNNKLVIINRWGNTIFEMENYNNSWRAEGVSDGVYFYIFYRDKDSSEGAKQQYLHVTR